MGRGYVPEGGNAVGIGLEIGDLGVSRQVGGLSEMSWIKAISMPLWLFRSIKGAACLVFLSRLRPTDVSVSRSQNWRGKEKRVRKFNGTKLLAIQKGRRKKTIKAMSNITVLCSSLLARRAMRQ